MFILGNVEEGVLVKIGSWSFSFQLEDHDSVVVAGRKQVDLGVSSNDPEPIVFSLEALHACSLVQVPHADGFVFSNRQNKVLVGVEKTSGGVLEVASTCIDLPCLCLAHPPDLDLSVIRCRDN